MPSTTTAESKGEVKLKLRVYRDISACAYHVQFTRIDAVARAHWLDTAAADELDKFRVDMEPEEEETRMQSRQAIRLSSECRAELNTKMDSIKDKPIALRDY